MKKKEEKLQFSKLIVVFMFLFSVVGIIAAVVLNIEEAIAIALISACGGIVATANAFYFKKAQTENTVKIYMSTYKEILKLKKKYNENCEDVVDEMEQNIKGKLDQTIDESLNDATSLLEKQDIDV